LKAQDIIIGSGPSGVAAAAALIARGRDVLMVDAGIEMDDGAKALRDRMGGSEPDDWTIDDRHDIGAVRRSEKSDSIQPFGCNFLFRQPSGADFEEGHGVHALRPSFAKGGLSNGWGGSVMPYHERDLDSWPIGIADLAPHYRAIAPMIGASMPQDSIADLFDAVQLDDHRPLPQSRQAQELLARMAKKGDVFEKLGVYFSPSRQAIAQGCRECAMCLYGCPYGLIFNAGAEVDRMTAAGQLRYQSGVLATRFVETADGVTLHSNAGMFEAERLFVAGGVLPTAQLALSSLDLPAHEVTILDSQHFYLPMLHPWSAGDPATEPRHTLAQVFWEIDDPAVDDHIVHTQLYTYNDTYAPDMRQRFGAFADVAKPLIEAMSRRLIVAQPYLHSDMSPAIGARLVSGRLFYRRIDNPKTAAAMKRVKRRVSRAAREASLLPLTPLARPGALGSSFHCGGSFPMRHNPVKGETDALGRPRGLKHVHFIDASIFTSIPAPTITFSVMANAHRIASES